MKQKIKKYRIFLCHILVFSLMLFLCSYYQYYRNRIPDSIYIKSGTSQELDWKIPASGIIETNAQNVVSFQKPVTIIAGDSMKKYSVDLKLFGIVPLKKVDIEVIENRELIPMGCSIGIFIKTQGVLVLDTGKFVDSNGEKVNPAEREIKSGDYLIAMDGIPIENKKQIQQYVEKSNGEEIDFQIERNKQIKHASVRPKLSQNDTYKIGVWLRDSAQGIGTLTYLDENDCFGALGHGIKDIDVGELMSLGNGLLYNSQILTIRKGTKGSPGEMTGLILYEPEQICGMITQNTDIGIYGVASEEMKNKVGSEALPIALKQEVEIGDACILCQIGDEPEEFHIKITDINYNNSEINQQISLQITDPKLLKQTGGIVQGMSGSPIIQNGKIVGAVTHVFVNDPTKGYGIFIENMLEHE